MTSSLRVFLDTSVLFAPLLSPSGGSRVLLKLGEAALLSLWVGTRGLRELEDVVRRKAPDSLPLATLLLDQAGVTVGPEPNPSLVDLARTVVDYAPDAWILAEALAAHADFFVTLDREHFLENSRLATLPFTSGTPGDCLAWIRQRIEDPADR